ncbi:beta-ketoacyl synthase N-terminal-like domain-containing protein [Rahnella bruchi]|uniref:beta-ketoacyl synthase N-terminal-like domain-containing protein n=1 Tax=Rahnella bruchi TaxID=1510573 RepID=UPI000EA3471E|nr:beta-ketoacyl synthase N-terminal-like domain-containing protein [Rahnella bruchi]
MPSSSKDNGAPDRAVLAGSSLCLPYATDSETLIANLSQGKCLEKAAWFVSERQARLCRMHQNKSAVRFDRQGRSVFDLLCKLIDNALLQAKLAPHQLTGDRVRVYLSGLGPRVDISDYYAFYHHNDIEDLKCVNSLRNLNVAAMSQDQLATGLARHYDLACLPPCLHCSSNSALSALHLGIQAIESAALDIVVVVNCSEIKTQDIHFLESQSMLEGEVVQPFSDAGKCVLPSEGFSVLIVERAGHRQARQLAGGIELTSVYSQISAGRSNDSAQLASSLLKVMSSVMKKAQVGCDDLCAIIPHGNGSADSDRAEAQAIVSLLAESTVHVLAYKGQIGYVTTGSGIVDLIIGHAALTDKKLISPVGKEVIRESISRHLLINAGAISHNKEHLLKVGLGVDGSVIGIVMSGQRQ